MAAPVRTGHTYTGAGSGTTIVLDPSSVTSGSGISTGDMMILTVASTSTVTVTTPSGWTVLQAGTVAGTLQTYIFAKIRVAGETTYTVTVSASANTIGADLAWITGADTTLANWQVGTNTLRTVDKTNTAVSVTATTGGSLALLHSTERTTTTEAAITSVTGATQWYFDLQSGSNIQTIFMGYIDNLTGATGAATVVYPVTQTANGMARWIVIPPVPGTGFTGTATLAGVGALTYSALPLSQATGSAGFAGAGNLVGTGVASSGGNGNASFTGNGVLTANGVVTGWAVSASFNGAGTLGTTSVVTASGAATFGGSGVLTGATTTLLDRWLVQRPMYVAHRAVELDWPEETLFGYTQAAQWNKDFALEVSVQQSSDGVWVASHDQTTGRVFSGTSLDIPSNTWATLSSKTTIVGGYPIAKLVDILDAFPDRVFWVDNKNTVNISNFLDTLDAHGGPARILVKGYSGSTGYASLARARGYKTWGFFYAADIPSLPTRATYWDLLGGDVTDNSTNWTTLKSYGKPIVAHTINNLSDKNTATAFGADGYMAAKATDGTVPQTPASGTFAGSGTLTGTGVQGKSGGATLAGGGALTYSAVAQVSATGIATLTGSGVLTASGVATVSASGTATFTGSGALNAVGNASTPGTGSAAFVGTGALTSNSVAGLKGSANLVGSGALVATGVAQYAATATLAGIGVLVATGVASSGVTGTASFTGAGVLSAIGKTGITANATFSGTGDLQATAVSQFAGTATFAGHGALTYSTTYGEHDITVTVELVLNRWSATLEDTRWEASLT